jgi:hypothetical protein
MVGAAREETSARRWRAIAARVSSAVVIGLLTGAIVGGLGGRIAMFVLRLTSDPSLRGLETDDGFTIGIVSGATTFLVGLTAILGAMGALAYLAMRPWVPPRLRPWTSGIIAGVAGGAAVIRPEGIDFRLLEPLGLAVAMFVALPAIYGAILALLVERSFRRPAGDRWRSLLGLPLLVPLLLPVALVGPFGLFIVLAMVAVLLLLARGPGVGSIWTSPVVTWLGRTALAVFTAFAGLELVRDVAAVL